ncbi:Transcription initiation factor IIB (TFIIB) [Candidatus Nitrososphaera evergladensis SR1]|uniref:Transcription initiation factor IIB (TFIIB) n=1 Tax=Candidatus Nitrososphaera evergladensis SR1 TaxID=1459636 RepID=A0A075MSK4_9ARCH|nr:TFIIB-type zinc ribbon-containing protein [Candidatus Nitrososphaera evergladensis]AIF84110.1 Transcription initiation factor IIB (TFIIB) [Candidatus Nitrososphaera evergladensis SR1]
MTTSEYCTQCPECSANLIQDYSKGEFICERCGYVAMDSVYDFGRESNATDFEEKSKNTRASGSTSFALHDYGLRTEIASGSKDYAGKSIDYQMAEQMNNIRKWHIRSRIVSPQERRLSNVLTKINETCAAMSLPKLLVETAAMLYRNYESMQEAKGKSIACMAAATIYLACKKCRVVRSLDEIVAATGVTEQDRSSVKLASKYYRMMVMEMSAFAEEASSSPQATPEMPQQQQQVPVTMAIDHYISKLSNMAKIDTKVERLAIDIAHKTDDHMLADGKAPNGLAAAYIYVSSILLGINILQRDVSSLSGVTEVTIRNRCKDMLTGFKLTITVKPQTRPGLA